MYHVFRHLKKEKKRLTAPILKPSFDVDLLRQSVLSSRKLENGN